MSAFKRQRNKPGWTDHDPPDRLDRILATSVVSRMFSQGDQMTVSARFCCAIVGSTTTACRGQIYKNVFHVQKKHLYVQSRNKWVLRNSFFAFEKRTNKISQMHITLAVL